jgi:hypothetical protein
VDPRGLEPLTSAMRGRRGSFPNVSRTCKTAGNHRISALVHFSAFQEIYPGCCTVAAQDRKNARGEWPPVLESQRRELHRAAHNYAGPTILPYRVSWSRNAS